MFWTFDKHRENPQREGLKKVPKENLASPRVFANQKKLLVAAVPCFFAGAHQRIVSPLFQCGSQSLGQVICQAPRLSFKIMLSCSEAPWGKGSCLGLRR